MESMNQTEFAKMGSEGGWKVMALLDYGRNRKWRIGMAVTKEELIVFKSPNSI